jgi:hypothetical protein
MELGMTDEEFVARFEGCNLANESFHHEDHVRMAFLYLCRYPVLEALIKFSAFLSRLADAKGKPGLYHKTITGAYLLLIRERMARAGREQSWTEFAAANADLLNWKDNVLKKYYQDETLSSDLARRTFLLPDRATPQR